MIDFYKPTNMSPALSDSSDLHCGVTRHRDKSVFVENSRLCGGFAVTRRRDKQGEGNVVI